jgi:hypothetical protein
MFVDSNDACGTAGFVHYVLLLDMFCILLVALLWIYGTLHK